MLTCPRCGCGFMPRARTQKLCGKRECRLKDQRAQMRERDRRYREQHGVSYFDRYKVERVCGCGATFRTRHGADRCPACARRAQQLVAAAASAEARRDRSTSRKQLVPAGPLRRAETLRYREALERLRRAEEGARSKRAIYVSGTCRRCGEPFACLWTNDLPRWCSRAHARADAKAVRRGRERGGEVVRYSRRAVFERDRWTCRLCGKRVKRTARIPHPKAPVIDHIVPLAAGPEAGGVDAPWNVQCAHFVCNSIKRDRLSAPALF